MTRLHADILLLLVALIWGFAFVAQKTALLYIGPFAFMASRFSISFLLTLPLALRERRKAGGTLLTQDGGTLKPLLVSLCIVFVLGVVLQQVGIATTSVTNAGFLTGLYVLFVPVICFVCFRQKISPVIIPAALLCVVGTYLLSGGGYAFGWGDTLIILCAVFFALHVAIAGRIMARTKSPFQISCLQYAVISVVTITVMLMFETPTWAGIQSAIWPILYAGVLSGGIAYTLQMIAQQHAPASDTAVILSAESVFAAIGGYLIFSERVSVTGMIGCGLIIAAILMVELTPQLLKRFKRPAPAGVL